MATPFTGAYLGTTVDPNTGISIPAVMDVNPSGQTFSGQNVIEMNAYNNAPILTNNTFNGSTDMNVDMTNITSTGNTYQNLDLEYNGLPNSYLESNRDTMSNATVSTSVSDINISNGTFNGSTTLQANNISLGSVSQMDNLLDGFYAFYYTFNNRVANSYPNGNSTVTVTSPWTGNSVTVQLFYLGYSYNSYDPSTNTISRTTVTRWCSFNNIYFALFDMFLRDFECLYNLILDKFNDLTEFLTGSTSYQMYTVTITNNGEFYSISRSAQTASWREVIVNRFDTLITLLDYYCKRFYNWYYPLDNVIPEYWRYYNTDTAAQEEIGLAGLMYNISWYLGQMYVLQTASTALDNFEDQVGAVTETLENAEEQEQAIISSISSNIESFNPQLSDIQTFRALSWCSNYLQQMFLAIGTYGTVILVGLILGVCMQFIGYFRYK